ncbi:hypothetical protein ACVWXM_000474 [Bradyrhizobium sp. GM7.3]
MATTRDQRQIVETPTEARQGEPGPSVAALLAISTGLAILIISRSSGSCSSGPDRQIDRTVCTFRLAA